MEKKVKEAEQTNWGRGLIEGSGFSEVKRLIPRLLAQVILGTSPA